MDTATKWCFAALPHVPPTQTASLAFQVLSSTIIRSQLSSGVMPDPRALHPSVFEFIRQRGLYGFRPTAAGASDSSGVAAAVTPPPSAPKNAVVNPASARVGAWGPGSKTHGTGKGTVAQALCSLQRYQHVSFGKFDGG